MPKQTQEKLLYTRSLGRSIARAAKRVTPGKFHIISSIRDYGKWCVVADKAIKPMRVFSRKSTAISFVKKYWARKSGNHPGEVIIHREDGWVENTISI